MMVRPYMAQSIDCNCTYLSPIIFDTDHAAAIHEERRDAPQSLDCGRRDRQPRRAWLLSRPQARCTRGQLAARSPGGSMGRFWLPGQSWWTRHRAADRGPLQGRARRCSTPATSSSCPQVKDRATGHWTTVYDDYLSEVEVVLVRDAIPMRHRNHEVATTRARYARYKSRVEDARGAPARMSPPAEFADYCERAGNEALVRPGGARHRHQLWSGPHRRDHVADAPVRPPAPNGHPPRCRYPMYWHAPPRTAIAAGRGLQTRLPARPGDQRAQTASCDAISKGPRLVRRRGPLGALLERCSRTGARSTRPARKARPRPATGRPICRLPSARATRWRLTMEHLLILLLAVVSRPMAPPAGAARLLRRTAGARARSSSMKRKRHLDVRHDARPGALQRAGGTCKCHHDGQHLVL